MDIKLCNTSDPREKIKKNVTAGTTFSCVLKENTSIFNPVIILESDAAVYNFNYMQIPSFGRFYFITDIRSIGHKRWEISGHVDVLNTYASGILSNEAVIKRQQNLYNLYLNDPDFQTYNNDLIQTKKFTNSEFDKTLSYVLVINGS